MMSKLLVLLAGISGAAGVALAALAAHGEMAHAGQISTMLLVHAPVLLIVGLVASGQRVLTAGTLVLALGLVLFCGDLLARDLLGNRFFAMAAPAGGGLMILGWLGIAISSLLLDTKER